MPLSPCSKPLSLIALLRASPIQVGQMGLASHISRPSSEVPAIAFPVQRLGSQRRLQTCNPKIATSTSGWPRWRLAEDPSLRPCFGAVNAPTALLRSAKMERWRADLAGAIQQALDDSDDDVQEHFLAAIHMIQVNLMKR